MLPQLMPSSMTENHKQFNPDQLISRIKSCLDLTLDSNTIQPGDVFVAIPGTQKHGLVYARQAIEHGASAIIFDPAEGGHALALELAGDSTISISLMEQPHLKDHIGLLASSFYQHPSHNLNVIGITGTNGKTSCSHFIAQALSALRDQGIVQKDCGYIGTLGWGGAGKNQPTMNTTPDAIALHRMLAALKQQGVGSVAMEVSSHGLSQNRIQSIRMTGAVFTNLGRDHLDYHQSVTRYLDAKLELFRSTELAFAIINQDDSAANAVADVLDNSVRVIGFSLRSTNHLSADKLTIANTLYHQNFTSFDICYRGQSLQAKLPLIGEFNVANALATVGVLLGLGIDFKHAVYALQYLTPVAGRMEKISTHSDNTAVYVDYAHTPDALEIALNTIKQCCAGKIWLVFGCGGNRDQGKRKQMGQIASRLADYSIITDDNPRDEDGETIINQIVSGCSKQPAHIIRDRNLAIQTAILSASPNDTVLIAGKGHETTQEINGLTISCDDRQIAKAILEKNQPTHSSSTEQ
ncbi:MAG TPA: UDP-N-acetylmuramoyl-L-alanyl-D-glutamate--2,6-diaminopimelate ligase [Crenotrichaceae bacterium]|nr:UDP-N-acetylmuramoyl-L-alanyl-D-glutamate--2,6-diaminopimelate ligase [Crenotrichaceae bacterium]